MFNQNTMGKTKFCISHIWILIAYLWYQSVVFRCIEGYSLKDSRLVLYGCVILVSVLFAIIAFRRSRNLFSILMSIGTGYGLYTVLSYIQYKKTLIVVSLIASAVLSVLCIVIIMHRRIDHRGNVRMILRKRINRALLATRTMTGLGMAVIVLVTGVTSVFGGGNLQPDTVAVKLSEIDEQTLANNIETVSLLEESRWNELTPQERVNVLQVVANMEVQYLGLPHELNVVASDLKTNTLGTYKDATHEISVSLQHLEEDPPEDVLQTILHEAAHAFQHRCVDAFLAAPEKMQSLRIFKEAEGYLKEFNSYIDGSEDILAYYNQTCEEDSRAYAEDACEDYFEKINAYYGSDVIGNWRDGDSCKLPYSVKFEEDGYAYLFNQHGNKIAGPYLNIESDIGWVWDEACRYTGLNGRIGYLDTEGREITDPVFIDASKMQDGKAMVSEKAGSIYYINSEGERITEEFFMEGFPYEHQSCYARVLQKDGWAIINRDGEVVFSGADSINELPAVTVMGSAVKNGQALLFTLDTMKDEEVEVIKILDQFPEISEVYFDSFAIVRNHDGLYGAVDYKGDLIIQPMWKELNFEIINDGEDSWYGAHIRFKLQNKDGSYSIKEIRL